MMWLLAFLAGLLSGVISGFGIGGGTLLLLYLTFFAGFSQRAAQGLNLLYFLPTALAAVLLHSKNRLVDWRRALPAAIFGMLVVYCLKNINFIAGSHGIPEAIGIAVTVLLHLWKRQMLLSIAGGTIVYMLLVQFLF